MNKVVQKNFAGVERSFLLAARWALTRARVATRLLS